MPALILSLLLAMTSLPALPAMAETSAIPESPAMIATSLPLTAESLAGEAVTLPQDLRGNNGLLIIGFTRTSREQTNAWATRLHDACTGPRLACFDVAVIAGVPGLLKGFVAGRIRDNTPKERQARFLLVREHEQAWRTLAGFDAAHEDDAWLLLLDGKGAGKGRIIWRGHGPWSQQLQERLLQHAFTAVRP